MDHLLSLPNTVDETTPGRNGSGPDSAPLQASQMTVAEYFAGIGLVRMGLEKAGWRVVFANDFDPEKHEMYAMRFADESSHYVVGDVFTLDPKTIPHTLLATSSFPCIDLSLAGNLNGLSGRHSSAFWGVHRILEAQGDDRPPLVMLENVPGWLTSNKTQDFRTTIKVLNDLGYVFDVFALNAQHFVPQSRVRIFAIGSRLPNSPGSSDLAVLESRPSALAPTQLKRTIAAHQDLQWRFLDLPSPPPLRKSGLADEVIETMPDDDPRWWPSDEVERHLAMMAPSHRARVDELAKRDAMSYRTIYRRRRNGYQRAEVRHGDTAGCLRTARGGSSRQIVVAAGQGKIKMRHMTPTEYARLQGAGGYPLPPSINQALTAFGDAVCVDAIEWIATHVLALFLPAVESISSTVPATA